ncbi:unnamed protein product, partial [Closterium sp. NIES-54]
NGPYYMQYRMPPVPVDPMSGLRTALTKQIEYYFSIENLCRDLFLRSKMDSEGFIHVDVIAAFNRVRLSAVIFG